MRKILFRNIICYVAEGRIKPEERIEGYNYYLMRHSDDDWSKPVTIESGGILVNYYGALACKEELTMENEFDPGRFEIQLTDAESDFIGCAAGADYEKLRIDESEEALTIEDFEEEIFGDDEEDSGFIANYDEEVEELLEENLNEIDLSETNIEIEQCNNEEE